MAAKDNRISKALELPNDQLVEQAYLTGLSRYPTATEKEQMLNLLDQAEEKQRREVVEDVYWALLSSKEFLFNH